MSCDYRRLARGLGHAFRDEHLLHQALTHRSAGAINNERLEFLGDALLGFVIAEALWWRFPDADEGRLSRMRASLVKKETLARLARERKLGDYMQLGAGELRTGGHARDSILADGLEAVFASVFLDSGFDAARDVILRLFETALGGPDLGHVAKDPKSRLQEYLQSRTRPLPSYTVTAISGSQHAQLFVVRCALADAELASDGRGSSRRRAEQDAARTMLQELQLDD